MHTIIYAWMHQLHVMCVLNAYDDNDSKDSNESDDHEKEDEKAPHIMCVTILFSPSL